MAWCAREYIWSGGNLSTKPYNTSHVCMTDSGWFQRKQNKPFSNSWRQITSNARELEQVTSLIQTYTSWAEHEGNAYKVSNTSSMFNMNHGGDVMMLMGSIAIHRNFHITGLPPSCEHGDIIGQTKICNGVCSRDQPRVRQHYKHRWFWFDLTIAHTPSQSFDKAIDPTTDHEDQSMEISSLFNTHTQG